MIPKKHVGLFIGSIIHPELFLWDSWSYKEAGKIHLYCLAVSRFNTDGSNIDPTTRNDIPFHVRHFLTLDQGKTWSDEGCFQSPSIGLDRFDSKSIWSGSIEVLPDGRKLVAYTGLRASPAPLIFQQSIGLAISLDGKTIDYSQTEALSCPMRDWQSITDSGYYLGDLNTLGHADGENSGPILAWRDPFIFLDEANGIHLFWSAKVSSHKSAIAHAKIEEKEGGFVISKLFPPVLVPDSDTFTQFELPKIIYNSTKQRYYLYASTCNRLYEGQSDAEVDKTVRIYESDSMDGPWNIRGKYSNMKLDTPHMFGLSVLEADFEKNELLCLSPFTEVASKDIALSLSRTFTVKLNH